MALEEDEVEDMMWFYFSGGGGVLQVRRKTAWTTFVGLGNIGGVRPLPFYLLQDSQPGDLRHSSVV